MRSTISQSRSRLGHLGAGSGKGGRAVEGGPSVAITSALCLRRTGVLNAWGPESTTRCLTSRGVTHQMAQSWLASPPPTRHSGPLEQCGRALLTRPVTGSASTKPSVLSGIELATRVTLRGRG